MDEEIIVLNDRGIDGLVGRCIRNTTSDSLKYAKSFFEGDGLIVLRDYECQIMRIQLQTKDGSTYDINEDIRANYADSSFVPQEVRKVSYFVKEIGPKVIRHSPGMISIPVGSILDHF